MTVMNPFYEGVWPKSQAVKIVRGNGDNVLAIFEDPNCGFCQRLDQQTLSQFDNLTVYIYLYPFLGEDSIQKSEFILGSPDPAEAFQKWMLEGIEPKPVHVTEKIKQNLRENIKLAESLGIEGTPAIFMADGTGPIGFVTAQELYDRLVTKM